MGEDRKTVRQIVERFNSKLPLTGMTSFFSDEDFEPIVAKAENAIAAAKDCRYYGILDSMADFNTKVRDMVLKPVLNEMGRNLFNMEAAKNDMTQIIVAVNDLREDIDDEVIESLVENCSCSTKALGGKFAK